MWGLFDALLSVDVMFEQALRLTRLLALVWAGWKTVESRLSVVVVGCGWVVVG